MLSPPHVGPSELEAATRAVKSGWIAPLGPEVDALELEFTEYLGIEEGSATALSSGSAALELAYRIKGVEAGDLVMAPTLTFVATVNAAKVIGAKTSFVDADETSWNIDTELAVEHLDALVKAGNAPKAVVAVQMYGTCSDWSALIQRCEEYEIAFVEDAAEALGSTLAGKPAGTLADIGIFSFNGNKIITCGGGGMLIADPEIAERARWLSTQAREDFNYYEHRELGFNYRLSNVSAAIARAQLARLDSMVARRREIRSIYLSVLGPLGIEVNPIPENSEPNCWLTVMLAPDGVEPDDLINYLDSRGIEARRAWKPMHMQPLYSDSHVVRGKVAEEIFERGICLPSGSAMSDEVIARVTNDLLEFFDGRRH
ncbi:MAG: DegT/DnrJ/EryC1/StrS family aminotransferase [Acidimicrobiales bacterium]